jgi:alpha-ribazole phosphatase
VEASEEAVNFSLAKIRDIIPEYTNLVYYASDLTRCKSVVSRVPGIEVIFSEKIREMNFGEWEMIPWDDIPAEPLKKWMDDFVNQRSPGGESYMELYNRSVLFWENLKKTEYNRVAVVTHSGVIRSILCYILNVSLLNSFKFKIDYSGISLVKISETTETIEFINK